MEYEVNSELFSIGQISKTCGMSRAMILKLENDGFITPASIHPDTGYRYYDCYNASLLQQYHMLRELGLGKKEIIDYYNGELDIPKLLKDAKARAGLLNRCIEEFEIRTEKKRNTSFSFIELPDVICYCGTSIFQNSDECAIYCYNLHHEIIEKGYTTLATAPIFSIRYDTENIDSNNPPKDYKCKVCIPIKPVPNLPMDDFEVIPGCTAFSMLYYGDYSGFDKNYELLWSEIHSRGLKPVGPVRGIDIVAPYTGMNISPSDYIFRFAVPVEV